MKVEKLLEAYQDEVKKNAIVTEDIFDDEDDDEGKTVAVSFDVNVPTNMKESEIEEIIRKAIDATDIFVSSYMDIHTLDESLKENISPTYKVGQKVMYRGKETEIVEVENDPEYGIDLLIKNPNWNGEDNRFENIWVGDNVKVIEESLNEDASKDALTPGIAMGSPTAVDVRNYIKQAIDELSNEKHRKYAMDQLTYYAETIIRSKQNFEDFDAYWAERYPAMLNLLDAQLEMIPREVIADLAPDVVEEDLSDRIRKGNLDSNAAGDTFGAEEDGVQIELQDREEHTHEFGTTTNQWGKSFVGDQLNKQPKVATKTWGRVWKDGKFDKSFEGPKYQVRAEMAKYLDSKK